MNKSVYEQNEIVSAVADASTEVDSVLIELFNNCFCDCSEQITLFAIGGYGAREVFPRSDIDIMFLLPGSKTNKPEEQLVEKISKFIALAWERMKKLSHSVWTIDEILSAELSVVTSILERRKLAGSCKLAEHLDQSLHLAQSLQLENFLTGRIQEQQARHKKHNYSLYLMEPHLKDSPGCMRDYQTICWISNLFYSQMQTVRTPNSHFFSAHVIQQLQTHYNYICILRWHLNEHFKRDTLQLEFIPDLATYLNISGSVQQRSVTLMQRYYKAARNIHLQNQICLQKAEELLHPRKHQEIYPQDKRFVLNSGGMLSTKDKNLFSDNPQAIFDLLLLFCEPASNFTADQQTYLGMSSATLVAICANASKLTLLREKASVRARFLRILSGQMNLKQVLDILQISGVLSAYLWEYKRVLGACQFDKYHKFPVDEHSLQAVKQAISLFGSTNRRYHPLSNKIASRLKNPLILIITALFHDLGKASGKDHSIYGAQLIKDFAIEHGFTKQDTEIMTWCVANHLLMSNTAQQKDIQSPDAIAEFATQVKSIEQLDLLYLLTIADMKATNDNIWNNWRAALLDQLYEVSADYLASNFSSSKLIARRKKNVYATCAASNISAQKIQFWIEDMGDRYFATQHTGRINWLAKQMLSEDFGLRCASEDTPFVAMRVMQNKDESGKRLAEFVIVHKNSSFLKQIRILHRLQLEIIDASVVKTATNHFVESYVVQTTNHVLVTNVKQAILQVKQLLALPLAKIHRTQLRSNSSGVKLHKQFELEQDVRINLVSNDLVKLHIEARDRREFLLDLVEIFTRFNLQVSRAIITTKGVTVYDEFMLEYISSDKSTKQITAGFVKKLKKEIEDECFT